MVNDSLAMRQRFTMICSKIYSIIIVSGQLLEWNLDTSIQHKIADSDPTATHLTILNQSRQEYVPFHHFAISNRSHGISHRPSPSASAQKTGGHCQEATGCRAMAANALTSEGGNYRVRVSLQNG
jgi:hypothetical protein